MQRTNARPNFGRLTALVTIVFLAALVGLTASTSDPGPLGGHARTGAGSEEPRGEQAEASLMGTGASESRDQDSDAPGTAVVRTEMWFTGPMSGALVPEAEVPVGCFTDWVSQLRTKLRMCCRSQPPPSDPTLEERCVGLEVKLRILRAVDVDSSTGQHFLTLVLLDSDSEVVEFAARNMRVGSDELCEDRAKLCRIMEIDRHFALPTILKFALGPRGERIRRYRGTLLAVLNNDLSATRCSAALEYLAGVGVEDASVRRSIRSKIPDQSLDDRRRLLAALALLGEMPEDEVACEHLLGCINVANPTAQATNLGIVRRSGACARLPGVLLEAIAEHLDSVHGFSPGIFESSVAPRSVGHLAFDCLRLAGWDRDIHSSIGNVRQEGELSGVALWQAWTEGGSFGERVAILGLSSLDVWVRLCALDLVDRHELRSADVSKGLVRLLRSQHCRAAAARVLVSGCPHWLPQVSSALSDAPDICVLALLRALQSNELTANMLQADLERCAETRNSAEVKEIAASLLHASHR